MARWFAGRFLDLFAYAFNCGVRCCFVFVAFTSSYRVACWVFDFYYLLEAFCVTELMSGGPFEFVISAAYKIERVIWAA